MPRLPETPVKYLFRGQVLHLFLLALLLAFVVVLVGFRPIQENRIWGITAQTWFVVALAIPIVHQVYVWLVWRSELCFKTTTKWFGSRGFVMYRTVFAVLLVSRPVSLTLLAVVDHDSIAIPLAARILISSVLVVPAIYTLYSVARYFGMSRAVGIDHFDPSYRNQALERRGMFRFTDNAMYTFAFLLLWAIAVAGASWAALIVGMFSHAYIWVHYFCTERPDMKLIYGQ
jgi:hypothetical protein